MQWMAVNLIKMAVGVRDVKHLAEIQAKKMEIALKSGDGGELRHITRSVPRRSAEIEDGGSLFWVIKGFISARQRILRVDRIVRSDGSSACALVLSPGPVVTEQVACRPFQGWRYMDSVKIPRDAVPEETESGPIPLEMTLELKGLGLL